MKRHQIEVTKARCAAQEMARAVLQHIEQRSAWSMFNIRDENSEERDVRRFSILVLIEYPRRINVSLTCYVHNNDTGNWHHGVVCVTDPRDDKYRQFSCSIIEGQVAITEDEI
jgi:hypothetical protein